MITPALASRGEVIKWMEDFVGEKISEFLKTVEDSWQPADLLPDATMENFFDEVKELRERARDLSYDLLAVLVGDTITEEALPTYESWLMTIDGLPKDPSGPWMVWNRAWTAEENRHGDVLNRYLYLSGRINMREMEASTQYLIADGFDLQTDNDPYRSFVYTSFQETATNISHRRVAQLAKKQGDTQLAKLCGHVAADEARHAKAYKSFVGKIFEADPNEMMLAFEDMMRKKIVMPAHYMRELGVDLGKTFGHFTDAAQRLGVYTSADYTDILDGLIKEWKIETLTGLDEAGERARDYVMALPARLKRVAERMKVPELEYKFRWIAY
ncbi:acyl-ACP desaturase [Pontibacter chinhatensis]|uniref:Acyl-[acyl-carrier-protein] desaturase n=1 Tax=Pontibacter chinhatensis TaxID=1436961 RepID=A0A1I2ZKA8_9BACT|nr:acyl-ACP desaturase [Pontibacter chinhatensis]SFH38287.1 acyl-[acyl-carrier-protein] desaturase [Pontibacter chinhatensis]